MAPPTASRLRVGDLLARSARVYARNFVPFVLIGAVVYAPWLLLELWDPIPDDAAASTLMWLAGTLAEEVTHFVLTGALSVAVVQQLRGRPSSDDVAKGLYAVGQTFGTAVMTALRVDAWIALGTLLMRWGRAIDAPYLGLLSLPLALVMVLQVVRVYVAMPVSVLEQRRPLAALRRSAQLTKGSRWQIFGAWLLLMVVHVLVVQALAVALVDGVAPWPIRVSTHPQWLTAPVRIVFAPLTATAMATCYHLLSRGRDQLDVDDIAAVFD